MKIELIFEEETFRKQMKLFYQLAYGAELKYYKNAHYLGFLFSVVGILIILESRDLGYLILFFGIIILIPYSIFYVKQYHKSKLFSSHVEKTISYFKENPKCTFEFTEELFKYLDSKSERAIKWNEFLIYKIIEDNLFMFTKTNEPFVIGKSETTEEKYKQILELVERKISN